MLLLLPGCVAAPLVERAIQARGPGVTGLITTGEARVYVGAPGTWEVSRAYLAPDRYAWKIGTVVDALYLLYDGSVVRSFIGTDELSVDASPNAPLRSHARWTAVVNLDALTWTGTRIAPVPAAALPAGVREGLLLTFADGAAYHLGFDEHDLLVWARGPLNLSPFAAGEITARFANHNRVGSFMVPFAISYALESTPIADERIDTACVNPPAIGAASFTHPKNFPRCP
jgi:hypothetical protein